MPVHVTSHMTISVSDMGNSQTMSDDMSRSIASAVSQVVQREEVTLVDVIGRRDGAWSTAL